MLHFLALFAGLLLIPAVDRDERDEVDLLNGKTLRGRILLVVDDHLIMRAGTREREVPAKEVKGYRSVFKAQGVLLERYAALEEESVGALLRLAELCRASRLIHEERLLYWRILLMDPQNQLANARLGHMLRGGIWRIRTRWGWMTFERLQKTRSRWGKAWSLRSEHYLLRSDADLHRVLDTLFELEYLYRYFYKLYQRRLAFNEILEPMAVHLYRDRKRFPPVSTHVETHFDEQANLLQTYLVGRRPRALIHEATHQLLYNVNDKAARGRGRLPAWLVKGWSEYMEGIVLAGRPGRPTLEVGHRIEVHFRIFQRARKPYGLLRVLNFDYSDFDASSGQGLKYAQSYVLFHYLMHAQGGTFQPAFFKYLERALRGQGQASTFRDLLAAEEIERDLINYR